MQGTQTDAPECIPEVPKVERWDHPLYEALHPQPLAQRMEGPEWSPACCECIGSVSCSSVQAATQANVAPWCDTAVTCAQAVTARGTSSLLPLVLIFRFIFSLLKENVNYLSEAKRCVST